MTQIPRYQNRTLLSLIIIVIFLASFSVVTQSFGCQLQQLQPDKIQYSDFQKIQYSGRMALVRSDKVNSDMPAWQLSAYKKFQIIRSNFVVGDKLFFRVNNTARNINKNNFLAVQVVKWWQLNNKKDSKNFQPRSITLFRNASEDYNIWTKPNGQPDINLEEFKKQNWYQKFNNFHNPLNADKDEYTRKKFETSFIQNEWHSDMNKSTLSTWQLDKRSFFNINKKPCTFEKGQRVFVRNSLFSFKSHPQLGKGVPFYIRVGKRLNHLSIRVSSSAGNDFRGVYEITLLDN